MGRGQRNQSTILKKGSNSLGEPPISLGTSPLIDTSSVPEKTTTEGLAQTIPPTPVATGLETQEKLAEGSWRMWALRQSGEGKDSEEFSEPGHYRYTREFVQEGQVPVEVHVWEQEDGPYYGWLATNYDIPIMVYANLGAFRICFPYGPEAEEKAGNGRILRLMIKAL